MSSKKPEYTVLAPLLILLYVRVLTGQEDRTGSANFIAYYVVELLKGTSKFSHELF